MYELEILDKNIKELRVILATLQEECTNAEWYSLILNNGGVNSVCRFFKTNECLKDSMETIIIYLKSNLNCTSVNFYLSLNFVHNVLILKICLQQ
jgi:hypothetical protein